MKPKPYVGITGFKTVFEVNTLADAYRNFGFFGDYTAMFGFATSDKKLRNKSKEGKSGPRFIDIPRLARATPKEAIAMVHYFTRNRSNLVEEVKEVFTYENLYEDNLSRAIQINQDWPDTEHVRQIKHTFPEMKVVIQIPQRAMDGLSQNQIVNRTEEYSELADYLLIDPSGGQGKEFDVQECTDLMITLNEVLPNTRVGVAGGFSEENVSERFETIASRFQEPFIIDAQERLRGKSKERSLIDLLKAKTYILEAANAIRTANKFYF